MGKEKLEEKLKKIKFEEIKGEELTALSQMFNSCKKSYIDKIDLHHSYRITEPNFNYLLSTVTIYASGKKESGLVLTNIPESYDKDKDVLVGVSYSRKPLAKKIREITVREFPNATYANVWEIKLGDDEKILETIRITPKMDMSTVIL